MARQSLATQKKVMTRKRLLIIGGLSAIVIAFVLFSSHGLLSRFRVTAERNALHEEVTDMKTREDSLRALINKLETDTLEIERLAREQYGFVKPGEKVYLIKQKEDQE